MRFPRITDGTFPDPAQTMNTSRHTPTSSHSFTLRSFTYFWQSHLLVLLCTAVATGVLAGALIVGDSVRGSLRGLTAERLGTIQHALVSDRFFPADVLTRPDGVPTVLLNGTVVSTETQARASRVNILGVTADFFRFWDAEAMPSFTRSTTEPFHPIIINTALQQELNVQVGDTVLVNVPQAADIHPEFLLGSRDATSAIRSLRLVIGGVIPTASGGRFNLHAHQELPMNVFMERSVLQNALGQNDRVNVVFTADPRPFTADSLQLTLDALDLQLKAAESHVDLQSRQYLLRPVFSETARQVASENRIPTLPTLTYLANRIESNGRIIPYSTVVALPMQNVPFPALLTPRQQGTAAPAPASDSAAESETGANVGERAPIVLNSWTASDLGVTVGAPITLTYYRVGASEEYLTESAPFVLTAVIPTDSAAAVRDLVPPFPGIHETADISDWESPFPIDYTLIRNEDETYWDRYGTTPKAFIPLARGGELWRNRFGDRTAIRMTAAPGIDLSETRTRFETEFLKNVQPAAAGFRFIALRSAGVAASTGATDFGTLFGSLSAFIISAVALLVGMLFRIGVEQRSREIGILQAIGYPLKQIRRRFLAEGISIACVGGLLGCLLALGYARLMIYGLQTWWLPAIGTPFMSLHISGWSLLIGALIALSVVIVSIYVTVRRLGNATTVSLLAGNTDFSEQSGADGRHVPSVLRGLRWLVPVGAIGVGCWVSDPVARLLLVALGGLWIGATVFDTWGRSARQSRPLSRLRFARRNAARQSGRSKTCVTTISIACCIVVAVGANRHDAPPETPYAFVAESVLPIHANLNTPDGRFELGFSDDESALLNASSVVPFRVLPGEDVSCLNLYQPQKPQILGAVDALLPADLRALLAQAPAAHGKVRAIGDENSLRWILHHDPSEDFLVEDEFGRSQRLELATVTDSLFQSQLVIAESNFTRYFPSSSGYQFFLIKTPAALRAETAAALERTLRNYGFDLTPASVRLANYRAVENTYISTFQSLGGLGVLLGTFGLALVLFRNIMERRGELATLRAFGFRRSLLSQVLFLESSFLLTVGLCIGVVVGLSAIFISHGHLPAFPWRSLTITLLSIFGFGIIANGVAVAVALRSPLLATLKSE